MIQIKKTILTLVALLAVTLFTGLSASAQNLTLKLSDALYDQDNYTFYAYNDGDKSIAEGTYVQINMSTYHTQVMNIYMNGEVVYTKPSGAVYTNDVYHFTAGPNCKILGGISNRFDWESNPNIYITMDAPASSATPVDGFVWNGETKTGTFTMPAGNVTVSVEYYPLATLAFQGLTAAEDAAAKTEAPLAVVADGAVTGGTLMYYVTPDKNFDQADAIALAETEWSAAIPTAETVDAAGTCYVWYYIKGDAEHSDTDPKPLAVTVLPEPTYTVEFAEGTPESDKWSAEPNAGVTKGTPVTVTYTGAKKVLGVKAEKKAKAAYPMASEATAADYGKVVCAAGHLHDAKTAVPEGCTAVGILGKVTETGHGLILALQDATSQNWNTIDGWTSASYAGTTLKVLPDDARGTNLTSYTKLGSTTVSDWCVAQKSDYEAIFTNLGSTKGDSDGTTYDDNVNAYITTGVGGTPISGGYWSATHNGNPAWGFFTNYWSVGQKANSFSVRPVLGF